MKGLRPILLATGILMIVFCLACSEQKKVIAEKNEYGGKAKKFELFSTPE